MDLAIDASPLKIGERVSIGISLTLIDLARRHTVTKHLNNKAERHFHGAVFLYLGIDIHPIFKMMAVAPFMVHPSAGKTEFFSFCLIRASRAEVVLCTRDKLCRRIFGQIVKEPLKANTGPKAMVYHAVSVACDGIKMSKRMHLVTAFPGWAHKRVSTIVRPRTALFSFLFYHFFDGFAREKNEKEKSAARAVYGTVTHAALSLLSLSQRSAFLKKFLQKAALFLVVVLPTGGRKFSQLLLLLVI